jgi:chemotaxis protein MotB
MAKKSCKCKATECEECPEWIFTFADLVMLMMGFFVILWVLKPNPGKNDDQAIDQHWIEVLAKIREAFDYLPDPKSKDPVDVYMILKKLEQMPPLKGAGEGGQTKLERHGTEGTDPEVTTVRQGKQATVGGRILFDVGSSELSVQARSQLDQIANLIRGHRKIVLIKGNTSLDDYPESATPQDRMNLSVRRAQIVADYLTSRGVEPEILRVQGCSTFEPIVMRVYTPDARLVNRRVEVEATDTLVSERQGSVPPTATKAASATTLTASQ